MKATRAWSVGALIASCGVALAGPPLTVYVYNSGEDKPFSPKNRGFNATASGFAWQEAGFLNDNGRPLRMNADGNLVNADNEVVGTRLLGADNTTRIGWLNESTNTAVIDVTHGKAQDAFSLYKGGKTGTMQIMTHGGKVQAFRGGELRISNGGIIYLDKNTHFGGFEGGTGGSVDGHRAAPYAPIAGIADSKIDLRLYSCFSNAVPGTNVKSVSATAADIKGVQSVVGSVPAVGSRVDVDFDIVQAPSGVTKAQVEAEINRFLVSKYNAELRAKDSNLAAYKLYANILKFRNTGGAPGGVYDYYDTTLNNLPMAGGRVKLNWKMTYAAGTELTAPRGGLMNRDFPWIIARGDAGYVGHMEYEWPDPGHIGSKIDLMITADAGDDSADYESLHLGILGEIDELPGAPIEGLSLQSSVMSLSPTDGFTDGIAGTWRIALAGDAVLSSILLYRLTPEGWTLLPGPLSFESDGSGPVARYDFAATPIDDDFGYTIAAFGVPAPSSALALVLGLAALRRRR